MTHVRVRPRTAGTKPTYDERLADRVRRILGTTPAVVEKRMFGGLAFMLRGHMCCGIRRLSLGPRSPRVGSPGEDLRDVAAREVTPTTDAMRPRPPEVTRG